MSDKTKKFFRINGSVIGLKTRKGILGLRIEAWDKDLILNDLVGSAVTDENGAFKIVFDVSYFAELFLDRQPDLFFKVFRDAQLLKSTEDSILWNLQTGKRKIEIELSMDAPDPAQPKSMPVAHKPMPLTVDRMAEHLNIVLPDRVRVVLHEHGIRTVDDIQKAGGVRNLANLPVSADDPVVLALDSFARLAPLEIPPTAISALMNLKIDSAFKLATLKRKDAPAVAKALGPSVDLEALVLRAQARLNAIQIVVANTLLYSRGSLPQWLTGEVSDACGCGCAEENSVVSRFAYLVDLLERRPGIIDVSGTPVHTRIDYRAWSDELKLDLQSLSPASGREQIPQIVLCNEVLAYAFPDPLTTDEKFLIRRCLIQAGLGLLPLTTRAIAEKVESLLPSSMRHTADLVQRLQEIYVADLLSPTPDFSHQELDALETVLRVEGLLHYRAEVDRDPEFSDAPEAERQAEAERRRTQDLKPAMLAAEIARRDVYKLRSRLVRAGASGHEGLSANDHELANRFCIEVTLDTCQMTTRLDQAIQSVQWRLDQLRDSATADAERARFMYLQYEQWRADQIGVLFPDIAALTRDEVFVTGAAYQSAKGIWDRGSIVANRTTNFDLLKQQLAQVEAIAREVKLKPGGKFADGPLYFPYFKRGLDTISAILDVDNLVQVALSDIDAARPGVALAKLADAATKLDDIASTVFLPASPWQNGTLITNDWLSQLPASVRKQKLLDLVLELEKGQKAIFRTGSDLGFMGYTPSPDPLSPGKFTNISDWWTIDNNSFRLGSIADDGPEAEGRIAKITSGTMWETVHSCYYRQGTTWMDVHLVADCMLLDARSQSSEGVTSRRDDEGEQFGIISNVQTNTLSRSYYRLVLRAGNPPPTSGGSSSSGDHDGWTWVPGTWADVTLGGVTRRVWIPGHLEPPTEAEEPVSASASTNAHTYYYLHLERVDEDFNGTLINRRELAVDSNPLHGYQVGLRNWIKFDLQIDADNLIGSVVIGSEVRRVAATDSGLTEHHRSGTIGLQASATVKAAFRLYPPSQPGKGLVPFFASVRGDRGMRVESVSQILGNHARSLANVALPVTGASLTVTRPDKWEYQLAGVEPVENIQFKAGEPSFLPDALDTLLNQCLALMFHLRFATLPLRMAQAHFAMGDYQSAVNLLRLVYDDEVAEESERNMYPYLANPPQGVVATLGPDSRLMRVRFGDIYLAWAEWLFRQNTEDSRSEARRLCRAVLDLHEDPDHCNCGQPVTALVSALIGLNDRALRFTTMNFSTGDLRVFGRVEPRTITLWKKIAKTAQEVLALLEKLAGICSVSERVRDRANRMPGRFPESTEQTLRLLEALKSDLTEIFEDATQVDAGRERDPYDERDQLIYVEPGDQEPYYELQERYGFLARWEAGRCIPEHPLIASQKQRACLYLSLLESCCNILGYTDSLVPPMRFDALVRYARSFADLALAAERDVLSFRQTLEAETYSLMSAQNSLSVSTASTAIEALRVGQADMEIHLANLQREQASFSLSHYEELIEKGLLPNEQLALGAAGAAWATSLLAIGTSAIPLSIGSGGPSASFSLGGLVSGVQSSLNQMSSLAALSASYERREQEWQYQMRLGRFGVAISDQNVDLALRRRQIAEQQRVIAELQHQFARDAVQFLANKSLNAAMWLWMMRTMQDQYRTRLNYAIAAAFMAERALAFELQSSVNIIRFDYYDPSKDGFLGATKLLTDMATLENTRLTATRRRLQLSKTFSLAQMMPIEFQRYLRNGDGRIPFSTQLEWFDHDTPGHFLRLIKCVKVTVLALTSPLEGIHATLFNNGISRVVSGTDFQEHTVRREPESIALTAPYQSSGVFVLNYEDNLLLPFEGSGVATDWVFDLPKAANRFDFNTLADVLITIEYTALQSDIYRGRVIQKLDRSFVADRSFSLRYQMPDQWYALHNPASFTPERQMKVEFETRDTEFPANIEGKEIREIAMYFASATGEIIEIDGVDLRFTSHGSSVQLGGLANTNQGIISTRTGSGAAWITMRQKNPVGQWTLTLPNTNVIKVLFENQRVADVIFVITIGGKSTSWSA